MGKRQQRRQRGISVKIPIVEYEDGGIYWREKIVGETKEEWSSEQFHEHIQKVTDYPAILKTELDGIIKSAASIALPHIRETTSVVELGRTVRNVSTTLRH